MATSVVRIIVATLIESSIVVFATSKESNIPLSTKSTYSSTTHIFIDNYICYSYLCSHHSQL